MDFSKAKPRWYKDDKCRSTCEAEWLCDFEMIGADAKYEHGPKFGDWKPDITIFEFPGLIIKEPIYAEIKSVHEVLNKQYRDYALDAKPFGITILLFGKFPTFIDDNDILDTMSFNIATALDLKTKQMANLRLGINLNKKLIFGLISDNQDVIKTTGEYEYITDPYQYEALDLLTNDVRTIARMPRSRQKRYDSKIRASYKLIKSILLSLEGGSTKWINTIYRELNMSLTVQYRDIQHETIITNKYSNNLLNNGFDEFKNHAPRKKKQENDKKK